MDCSFCGREIRKGLDSIYVTSKGKMHHFCSSKCEKNMLKLGRSVRKVRWTKVYRKEKEARLKLLKEGLSQEEVRQLQKKTEEKEEAREGQPQPEKKPEKKEQEKEQNQDKPRAEKQALAKEERKQKKGRK